MDEFNIKPLSDKDIKRIYVYVGITIVSILLVIISAIFNNGTVNGVGFVGIGIFSFASTYMLWKTFKHKFQRGIRK